MIFSQLDVLQGCVSLSHYWLLYIVSLNLSSEEKILLVFDHRHRLVRITLIQVIFVVIYFPFDFSHLILCVCL